MGRAMAVALADAGAELILSARREGVLMELRDRLPNATTCHVVRMDMESFEEIDRCSRAMLKQGAIDILICNAGISQRSLARDASDEVDVKLLKVDLLGPIRHTKALLPAMRAQGHGHIVVISSVTGKIGTPYRSSYAAAKHGLHGFFDSLRAEESDSGISVSIICPGYISTDVSSNALTDTLRKQGTIDQNSAQGMSPTRFAKKALAKIAQNKAEVYIGGKEILAIYLKRFAPAVLRRVIKNVKP